HLRAVTAAQDHPDPATLEAGLYDRRFLIARPLLQALEHNPSVLLVDEIDRADDEFEAFLLEVLADAAITVPELGRIVAEQPPLAVLTSNRTREVHDALKRRCLYHWVEHPGFEREVAILRARLPEVTGRLAQDVARATRRMRERQPPLPMAPRDQRPAALFSTPPGSGTDAVDSVVGLAASGAEVLRHRDVGALSTAERDEVRRLVALLAPGTAPRPSRRYRP